MVRAAEIEGQALSDWATLCLLTVVLAGCAVVKDEYLVSHVGRVTEQEVKAKLGAPRFMQPGEAGGIRWVYRDGEGWLLKQSTPSGTSPDCVEYHLTFDSRKVLTGWTKTAC